MSIALQKSGNLGKENIFVAAWYKVYEGIWFTLYYEAIVKQCWFKFHYIAEGDVYALLFTAGYLCKVDVNVLFELIWILWVY